MDDTYFDLLCKGLSADEAKLFRKMLAEWSKGDENSFPVQFALLTRVQWRAAALVPQSVNESRKLIERHLAEYRQQTAALVQNLSTVADEKTNALKKIVETHVETVNKTSASIRNQLSEAEATARRIRNQLDSGFLEWKKVKDDFAVERQKLEAERKELAARIQLRDSVYVGFILFGAIAFGMLLEYYLRN